jgi:hypothetical protein
VAAACCIVPEVLSPESESQSFGTIDRPKSLSPVPCGLLLSREVGPGTGFPWVWMVVWGSLDSSATGVEILTIEWWKHVATKHHAMDRTTSTGRESIRGLEGFLAWRGSSTIIEVRLRSRQTSKQDFGEEIGGRSAPAAAAAAVLPVMTNNDSNHQKWDGLIHALVLGKFHSIGPTNTAGYLALPRVVKPIDYCLPDPGVDIRCIPSARFCGRISVLAPPGHHTRSQRKICITHNAAALFNPHVSTDHDSSGEHPVQHTVLTHQPLQDYNARRAGRAASVHVRALCYSNG